MEMLHFNHALYLIKYPSVCQLDSRSVIIYFISQQSYIFTTTLAMLTIGTISIIGTIEIIATIVTI